MFSYWMDSVVSFQCVSLVTHLDHLVTRGGSTDDTVHHITHWYYVGSITLCNLIKFRVFLAFGVGLNSLVICSSSVCQFIYMCP